MARTLQGTSCAPACVVVDDFFVFVCAKDVQRYELSFCNELSCMDVCLREAIVQNITEFYEIILQTGGGQPDFIYLIQKC